MQLIKILFPLLIVSIFCSAQDKTNDDIFPPDLDTVRYVPYRKGKTWFYVDRQHKGPWGYGLAKAWPEEWDMADPFNEYGIALVEKNGRLGFINKNGKSGSTDGKGNIIIPFIYDVSKSGYPTLKWITPNLIRAQLNGKWGIIDRNNKILVPFKFSEISAS